MAKQFLHLGVHFESGESTNERVTEIQNVLNKATDWFRYAPNCWLIYTNHTPIVWHKRLKSELSWIRQQSYLICEANLDNRSGWLPQTAWDWIKKNRGEEN
jgi:hypothetical protein